MPPGSWLPLPQQPMPDLLLQSVLGSSYAQPRQVCRCRHRPARSTRKPHTPFRGRRVYAYFGRLKDCTHVCCRAHVRRILVSALKDYKDPAAEAFVNLIGLLYKVEVANILLHRTEAEILKARKTESMPVLTELYQKVSSLLKEYRRKAARISEKLRQGLEYMLNHWQELAGYVNFGNVLIDNNCCERTVRPFTNLRKNFGGFSSRSGGETTAVYLSFIETCKLRKKGVLDFFREFFGMAASGRTDYEAMSEALLC